MWEVMEPEYLDYVKSETRIKGVKNIETVLAEENSLEFENDLNLIFLRNVFHHIPEPLGYFNHLKQFLAPDGRIVIIDYKKTKKINFVNLFGHYTSEADILNVMRDY